MAVDFKATFTDPTEFNTTFTEEAGAYSANMAESGPAGVSPTATVERTADGVEITLTDRKKTTKAVVYDGTKGDQGEQGERGEKGEKGDQGERGERGPQGVKGETGARGPQGEPGAKGEQGERGYTGAQGPKGEKGDAGHDGVDGRDGTNGKDGAPGKDGKTPVKGVDYFTESDLVTLDNRWTNTEYVDESINAAMVQTKPVRKLNTNVRQFSESQWATYGTIGREENWNNTSNYADFNMGDYGALYGRNTTNNKYVVLLGIVTQVTNSLRMSTVKVYVTDTYEEVTEYEVDIAQSIQDVSKAVSNINIPTRTSQLTNDSGYLTKHQDISGKLDTSTFNAAMESATTALNSKVDTDTFNETIQNATGSVATAFNNYDAALIEYGEMLNNISKDKEDSFEVGNGLTMERNNAGKQELSANVTENDIKPISKKTYRNIIAKSNTVEAGIFYCVTFAPNDYYEPCRVKLRVKSYINENMTNANKALYYSETVMNLTITGNTASYDNTNTYYNSSYRAHYYISCYRTNEAGVKAGKLNYIGVSLYSAASPTSTTLKRDIEVEILEYENCKSINFLDEMVLQSEFYSSTYYPALTHTDGYSLGNKHSGDNNTVDRICYSSFQPVAGAAMYGSQILLSADGITYYSMCTSRTTETSSKCTDVGFLPEHILYYSSGTTIKKGSRTGTSVIYDSLPFDARYSINCGQSLKAHAPIYLKCTYTDGLYYLDPNGWYTQTLPTESDGYSYILLGYTYNTYCFYLKPYHPVYTR